MPESAAIASITWRRILNSHARFASEFEVTLDDGSFGRGSAPEGETKSIFEGGGGQADPSLVIERLAAAGCVGAPIDQSLLDEHLEGNAGLYGRANVYALSVAFYDALWARRSRRGGGGEEGTGWFPKLCVNILNGGAHAYTNPVLSDFHEYLVVSRDGDLERIVEEHEALQAKVKERLKGCGKKVVGGNAVHVLGTGDNRECLDLLSALLEEEGLSGRYDLMIDAAGTDLRWEGGYRFSLTDGRTMTGDELCRYWAELTRDYGVGLLEDPFHEEDWESWKSLSGCQQSCRLIGDDFHSGDHARIRRALEGRYMDGVMLKPDQAGSVSATTRAIEAVQGLGKTLIMSHRSISTESLFLARVTCGCRAEYIKNGPMFTDYSAILRLNEILRCR